MPMLPSNALLAITALPSLMMLLATGSLRRSRMPGMREGGWANLAVIIALSLFALRDILPNGLSIVAAHTLMAVAASLYYAGCARFLGHTVSWHTLGAGLAVIVAGIIYGGYLDEAVLLRIVAASILPTVVYMAIAVRMLRHRRSDLNRGHVWLTASLALVFATAYLVCVGRYALPFLPTPALLVSADWDILMLDAVAIPVMTIAVITMTHDAMLSSAEEAANRDHLTGALSRKHFDVIVRQEVRQVRHRNQPLSLLLIDLDHFKHINDTLGHAGGDTVLREFARMARAHLREADSLGRLGDEVFAVLMPDTDTAGAMRIADRLRRQAARHVVTGPFGICHYTISGGVATLHEDETFERLAIRADRALYAAKLSGRNLMLMDVLPAGETASEAG